MMDETLLHSVIAFATGTTRKAASWLLDDRERAQIAAVAALSAARSVDAGRHPRAQLAYLGRHARGAIIDALRAERRCGALHGRHGGLQRADFDSAEVAQLPAPEQPERLEQLRRAAAAAQTLPGRRPLVAWRLAEGATVGEIAAELGISSPRVSVMRREICARMAQEMTR